MVLIETYWNVNILIGETLSIANLVLIETYWNVNTKNIIKEIIASASLNRNILECKYGFNCSLC